jgi:hypothetical protein
MTTGEAEPVQVSQVDSAWIRQVTEHLTAQDQPLPAVTVMPIRIDQGVAIFADANISTPKELRASGVTADFLRTPNGKQFLSQYSSIADIVGAFLFSMGSDAAWDACKVTFAFLKARFGLALNSPAHIRVGASTSPDGTRSLWYELHGPAGETFEIGERLIESQISAFLAGANDAARED